MDAASVQPKSALRAVLLEERERERDLSRSDFSLSVNGARQTIETIEIGNTEASPFMMWTVCRSNWIKTVCPVRFDKLNRTESKQETASNVWKITSTCKRGADMQPTKFVQIAGVFQSVPECSKILQRSLGPSNRGYKVGPILGASLAYEPRV